MMMVQFLLDAGEKVVIPGVDAPVTDFSSVAAPVELALEQERRVTSQIEGLVKVAREEDDLVAEQFLHWFLQEQREEVASMSDLLTCHHAGDNVLLVEDYPPRESGGENPLEQGASRAGGAL